MPGPKQRIPQGWEYVTTDQNEDAAWRMAIAFKQKREELRPDLFVRVKAIPSGVGGWWWIIRKEEKRVKHG